jgi:hypothetical protein
MNLPNATVTRIKEELNAMLRKMQPYHPHQIGVYEQRDGSWHGGLSGDDHRAIEDFVSVLLNEILLPPGVSLLSVGERRQNHRHGGMLGKVEDMAHQKCRENGVGVTGTLGEDA